MRRVLYLLATLGFATMAAAAATATRVDLNRGWALLQEKVERVPPLATDTSSAADEAAAKGELVDLPHTWNRAGATYDTLGQLWYFKRFDLPKLAPDAIAQLHFGAVFYKARVFLNNSEIGSHEGGFHAFSFDVSKRLAQRNVIAVLVDNRPGMYTIPGFGARGSPDAWYDWWAYGGITRDVWLDIHGPVRIAGQTIRSKIEGRKARVTSRVSVVNHAKQPLKMAAMVRAPSGRTVAIQTVALAAGDTTTTLTFDIDDVEPWDLDHARLYRMDVEVADSGQFLAKASEHFGLRTIEIRDRHLLLNGQRVRLTGMTRHADSPWEGAAETRGTLAHDWQDMKSLNMTLTRPVHYAPDPWVMDFADRHGILLIPEIPIWQASEDQLSNPRYLELAKLQMRELIEQYGNHPSVLAWSVLNESAAGSPGGIKFFRAMKQYINELDPGRLVTLADDNLPKLSRAEESAANDADFLMMNEYFGAWHGPREALNPALDQVNALFPGKMVIISELGFPGTFAPNAVEADKVRVSILREQLPELAKRDWIAGAILWCYQDYKSRRYFWPGQEGGYLEHGLVDPDRQRKPSYFAWRELNEPARAELAWSRREGAGAASAPAAFTVVVTPNGAASLPYVPLDGYKIVWQLTGAESRAFAGGERAVDPRAPVRISADVPKREKDGPFRLVVKLVRPDGSVAMERALASQ